MAVCQEIKEMLKTHHANSVNRENFLGMIWMLIHVEEPEKNRNILLYLFSPCIWFTNTAGFILQRKFFSHFLLLEDFISCTSLKIHRKIKKKNLHAAIYHHVGTSSAYAQGFKTASAVESRACSACYWPVLTLQSAGKTHHWGFLPSASLYQGCTFWHCAQVKSPQNQRLVPEHSLVPGTSCQALFCQCFDAAAVGKNNKSRTTERGGRQQSVFSCP